MTWVNLQVIKRKKLPAALRLAFHDCVGELISVLNVLYSLGQRRPSWGKAWQDNRARIVEPVWRSPWLKNVTLPTQGPNRPFRFLYCHCICHCCASLPFSSLMSFSASSPPQLSLSSFMITIIMIIDHMIIILRWMWRLSKHKQPSQLWASSISQHSWPTVQGEKLQKHSL